MVSIPIKVEIELSEDSKNAIQGLRDALKATKLFDMVTDSPLRVAKTAFDRACEDWVMKNAAAKLDEEMLGYTRAEVLREEYVPTNRSGLCVSPDNEIQGTLATTLYVSAQELHDDGWAFAPTRELAEEIVAIREGNWLPKKGDFACGYNSKNGKCSSWIVADMEHDWTEEGREPNCHYFPSSEQRTRYIEKQKAKEAVKSDPNWLSYELKLPDTYNHNSPIKLEFLSAGRVSIIQEGKAGFVGRDILKPLPSQPTPCKTCGGTGRVEDTKCMGVQLFALCPDCKREEKRICVTYSPLQSIQKGEVVKFEDGLEYVALKVWNDDNATHVEYRKLA